MELRNLRHFVAVADTLSFRAAADRVHLTQPSLTRSIAGLERELGVRLFDRDSTRVSLTPAGSRLLGDARDIVERVAEFESTAKRMASPAGGLARVGIYPAALAEMTDPLITEFQRRYPEVELRVRYVDPSQGLQPLLRGELDVALVPAPTSVPGLRVIPIFSEPIDAMLPADHRFADRDLVSIAELVDDPWVFIPGAIPNEWVSTWLALEHRGGRHPDDIAYATSTADLFAAIAYQKCVGVAPRSGLRVHPHAGVVGVATDMGLVDEAVVLSGQTTNPDAIAFAELAKELAPSLVLLVPDAVLA